MTKTDDVIMERRDSALLRRFLREHLAQTERLCVIMSDADILNASRKITDARDKHAPWTVIESLALALAVNIHIQPKADA